MRLTSLAFALLSVASAAAGDCPDQTQTGLNQCAAEAHKKADEELNRAYKKIVERLKGEETARALLADAQKKWIAFREAECAFQGSASVGGSIHPMIVSECLESVTARRTKELRYYLKCEEGDLSCPVPAD